MFHKIKQIFFCLLFVLKCFQKLNTNKNNQKEFESEMKKNNPLPTP